MPVDSRVRIVLEHEGAPHYFVRFLNETKIEAVPFDQIRRALLLDREFAVALCQKLNERGYHARVITPGGVILYEQATTPKPPQSSPAGDRVPHHIGDVLIVPGAVRGFYIRFPSTTFESLYGETADAAYQKLAEHPCSAELLKVAERYVPPPEEPIDVEALQRQLEFARHGRIRPGI
jgi:hypothetical protein